jgi:SAM-dependent methyltransferase
MEPTSWIPDGVSSLLDVGCNVGELLVDILEQHPGVEVVGVEVNEGAIEQAVARHPHLDVRHAGAEALPFPDESFDCVTCIEVLEHLPAPLRPRALREMHRVLRPGGRLVLRVPHAGLFRWLDPNNFRFHFPRAYRRAIGPGRRDSGYTRGSEDVVWHQHFTEEELLELAGNDWDVEGVRRGALLVFPLVDIVSWPFYRLGRVEHPIFRMLLRIKKLDLSVDYGAASYDILIVLRRQ